MQCSSGFSICLTAATAKECGAETSSAAGPYQIGFCEPRAEVRVDVAQARDSKCMHVLSRRKRLDSAKARMVETSGKDHMPIQPSATWSDLRERHTYLKGDTSLLGQNSHGPNRSNGCNHLLIETRIAGGLPRKWWASVNRPQACDWFRLANARRNSDIATGVVGRPLECGIRLGEPCLKTRPTNEWPIGNRK
jgi:hypothetical protein